MCIGVFIQRKWWKKHAMIAAAQWRSHNWIMLSYQISSSKNELCWNMQTMIYESRNWIRNVERHTKFYPGEESNNVSEPNPDNARQFCSGDGGWLGFLLWRIRNQEFRMYWFSECCTVVDAQRCAIFFIFFWVKYIKTTTVFKTNRHSLKVC